MPTVRRSSVYDDSGYDGYELADVGDDSRNSRVVSEEVWAVYQAAEKTFTEACDRIESEGWHTTEYAARQAREKSAAAERARNARAMQLWAPSEEAVRSKFPPEWVTLQDAVLSRAKEIDAIPE